VGACSHVFVREETLLEKGKSEEIAVHLGWEVVGVVTFLPWGMCPPGLARPVGTLEALALQLTADVYLVYWFCGLHLQLLFQFTFHKIL